MKKKPRNIAALVGFPLLIIAIGILFFLFRNEIIGFFKDPKAVRTWLESLGPWGFLAFIGLQFIQVVVFIIPGEAVQIAGGFAFGFWQGTALSLAGITLGSIANFYVGRLLGRPFVESIFAADKVKAIEKVTGSGKAAAGFFLLFLIPGIPKDALCYVAGFSDLPLLGFFVISMVGRLPGILGSSYMGSAAFDGNYTGAILVLSIAAFLFIAGFIYRVQIEAFLSKALHRKPADAPDAGSDRSRQGKDEAEGVEGGPGSGG